MSAADWDREPTSAAERARWRVAAEPYWVVTDDSPSLTVANFATPELAAEAVWAHNVMHAAREKRALGMGLHDGCVAREALVQVGWRHWPDAKAHPFLRRLGDEWDDDGEPVFALRADENWQATRGAK